MRKFLLWSQFVTFFLIHVKSHFRQLLVFIKISELMNLEVTSLKFCTDSGRLIESVSTLAVSLNAQT